jgi:hypothetical protein
MADEARAAADRLQAAGWTDILVRGAMRQATAFLVGTTLPDVRGPALHYTQRGQEWSCLVGQTIGMSPRHPFPTSGT